MIDGEQAGNQVIGPTFIPLVKVKQAIFIKVVLTEDARRFADQMGIQLFETSAKDNINVEEMFRSITTLVLKSKKDQKERLDDPSKIDLGKPGRHGRPNQKANPKSKCCK